MRRTPPLPLLFALACFACKSSGSGGGDDFSCGTTAPPPKTATIAAEADQQPPTFAGGDLGTSRWVLESVQPAFSASDNAQFVGKSIGLALEFTPDGKYAEATIDSNGAVARQSGTFTATTGTKLDFDADCRPDKEPDGVKAEITVSSVDYNVDGDTLTMRGYVSALTSSANESTSTATPMKMILKRQ